MARSDNPSTPIFVLGTGRCGSTTLSDILNAHPRILSLSEFISFTGIGPFRYRNPDGRKIWKVLSGQRRRTRLMLAGAYDELLYPFGAPEARYTRDNVPPILCTTLPHLTADHDTLFDTLRPTVLAQPRQSTSRHYRALFAAMCSALDRDLWIERSGGSLLFASTLLEAFPDARIVHLYRDGRDTALSMSTHYLFQYIAANLQNFRRLGADPYELIASDPSWDRKALRLHRLSAILPHRRFDPKRVPPLEEFGKLWTAMIRRSEMLLADLPDPRVHRIRFEHLCAHPRQHLEKLIEFIDPGLADNAWLHRACKIPRPASPEFLNLPLDRRRALASACRPGLEILGYNLLP